MNLQEAVSMQPLYLPQPLPVIPKTRTKHQVGRRVSDMAHMIKQRLTIAAGSGEYLTGEQWADRWLSSKKFVLMEVDINAAACCSNPAHPDRVKHFINAGTMADEPIVIDLNKRKRGMTALGYIPEIVVLDGKHRTTAARQRGEVRIMAWVGTKALKRMALIGPPKKNGNGNGIIKAIGSPLSTACQLRAAVGMSRPEPVGLQDTGEAGSRPHDTMHSKKKVKKLRTAQIRENQGPVLSDSGVFSSKQESGKMARSSGSLEESSSDSLPIHHQKKLKWNARKSQVFAPGTKPGYTDRFGQAPLMGPGTGVGPRVLNKGATNSDFSRVVKAGGPGSGRRCVTCKGKGRIPAKDENSLPKQCPDCHGVGKQYDVLKGSKLIKKMRTKKRMKFTAPPGREEQSFEVKRKVW
jgi:hypothetical protein